MKTKTPPRYLREIERLNTAIHDKNKIIIRYQKNINRLNNRIKIMQKEINKLEFEKIANQMK